MIEEVRLKAICSCVDELARARSFYGKAGGWGFGIELWEVDQLTELHRLLYDE